MKSLALIVFASTLNSAPVTGNLGEIPQFTQVQTERRATWSDVTNFLDDRAVAEHPLARTLLNMEASLGVKTWTVDFTDSTARKMQGGNLGWPAASCLVTFETSSDAMIAASLIDSVTFKLALPDIPEVTKH